MAEATQQSTLASGAMASARAPSGGTGPEGGLLNGASIPTLIRAGYGVLILMLLLMLAGGYLVISKLSLTFEEYKETSLKTTALNNISEDLFEARIAGANYLLARDPQQAEAVLSNVGEIVEDRGLLLPFAQDAARSASVRTIQTGTGALGSAFGDVVSLNDEIAARMADLASSGTATREALSTIRLQAFQTGNAVPAYRAGVVQEALMLSRYYATRFAFTAQPAFYDRATSQVAQAKRDLEDLAGSLFDRRLADAMSEVDTGLSEIADLLPELRGMIETRDALVLDQMSAQGRALQDSTERVLDDVAAFQARRGDEAAQLAASIMNLSILVGVLLTAAAIGIALLVSRTVTARVQNLADTTDALVAGDLDRPITGQGRQDETGRLARALVLFRDSRLEHREREARDQQAAQERTMVVDALSDGLSRLSDGDLDARMETALARDFETLRDNFNRTAAQLADAISGVMVQTGNISSGAGNLSSAADELARRTEGQAAALEETAATIVQLSESVTDTAQGADTANRFVATARAEAENSLHVVSATVEAIKKIQATSSEVSQIIGVIDDIAFQTNLLALNAGVEAARAGDAGQGFAVVASEVRALAQRASTAAREIKDLIETSVTQVDEGVVKADQTGEALTKIVTMVTDISGLVETISAETRTQADGLKEINAAVSQLDSVTQQNAAMVEETTAASHDLTRNTRELTSITNRFSITRRGAGVPARDEAMLDQAWTSAVGTGG